jgi:hypothetical protein
MRSSQDHVQHDVLDHRGGQHHAGKPRGQQVHVVHDPGDHRDAGHRHRHPEDQDQRGVIAGRADELPDAQHGDQAQARRERQDHPESGDQADRTGRVALQQPAHFRASGEHQQQQAELVDSAQRRGRHARSREDPVLDPRDDRSQDRGTEQDAARCTVEVLVVARRFVLCFSCGYGVASPARGATTR